MSIRIITDSASDIRGAGAEGPDSPIIIPLTINFDGDEYRDGVDLDHEGFYLKLIESDTLPVTSQVTPAMYVKAIDEALAGADQALIITLSSELSGTWNSAVTAAEPYGDRVRVFDSLNVALGQRMLVDCATRMIARGMDIDGVVAELERLRPHIHLVAMLDTLEYLKAGGRISATAAAIGGVLQVKPVISVVDGKVVMVGKARGSKKANNLVNESVRNSGGIEFGMPYYLGYTGLDDSMLCKYVEDAAELWQPHTKVLPVMSVGGTIGTHIGPGAIAMAWFDPEIGQSPAKLA